MKLLLLLALPALMATGKLAAAIPANEFTCIQTHSEEDPIEGLESIWCLRSEDALAEAFSVFSANERYTDAIKAIVSAHDGERRFCCGIYDESSNLCRAWVVIYDCNTGAVVYHEQIR